MNGRGGIRRCRALDLIFGSVGAAGIVVLFGCLLSSVSNSTADAPPSTEPTEIEAALDTLEQGRWDFVEAMLRGSLTDLRRIAASRERAADRLSLSLEDTSLLRALDWTRRTQWLQISLSDRREDWGRPLLTAWASPLPRRGDPLRGPAALALGLVALSLAEQDPEEGSAYLAGQPRRSIDAVAEDALEAAAEESFSLRDEAMYRLAVTAESEGDTTAALEWADSLLFATPASPRLPEARAVRARSLFAAGNYLQAAQEARLGLTEEPTPELRWIAARALAGAGRLPECAAELEALILAQPANPLAVEAWDLRQEMALTHPSLALTPDTEISLLTSLLNNASSGAEEQLRALQERPELSPAAKENLSLSLARYLSRKKRYEEALPRLQALLASSNVDLAKDARLQEARIYRNTGRLEAMERAYRFLIKARGEQGAVAAWELAKEWESRARWREAERTYTEILTYFPDTARRRDVFFRRGFARRQRGGYRDALADFRNARRLSLTPAEREQAAFWTAHTLWAMGRRREALTLARRAAGASEPADAYGVLLRDRFAVPENVRYPQVAEPKPSGPLGPEPLLAAASEVRAAYRDGLARLELGLQDAARRAWRGVAAHNSRSPQVLQAFTFAATAYSFYPEGVQWAKLALDATALSDPKRLALRRLAYPAAYAGTVVTEASRYDLDPAWVWALMRQESYYDSRAVSRAGALGLMQVMPITLAQMTAESQTPPLPSEVLFHPSANITFGTRFLAERLAEFDDRLLPTLASYNAGEAKSREWMERAEGDTEEVFMECIGYPETYDYVRRILWISWLYHSIYPEGRGVG